MVRNRILHPSSPSIVALFAMMAIAVTGCNSVLTPISGIPVSQLPDELLGVRRSEFRAVPVVMLTRPQAESYTLDEGDILSVYIDGIMPFSNPNTVPISPPVNFPDAESDLPPSVGYPVPVQEKGLVNLPLLRPFSVEGMTVEQAREEIESRYREEDFLRSDSTHPVVSLMKRREYTVTVIRYNAGEAIGTDGTAAGYTVSLPATRNDVLNALMETGGLPGFNERNEVVIYRTSQIPPGQRDAVMAHLVSGAEACGCYAGGQQIHQPYDLSGAPSDNFVFDDQLIESRLVVRIPLRHAPGQAPQIPQGDVILDNGDIVMVESRETEFFYTGGLLSGAQHPLPRDYDLDVLGAMAISGQGLANTEGNGGGRGLMSSVGGSSPTQLIIVRKMPCGRTFNIAVDLQQAVNIPSQNILVQPGDTLILRYKPHEELLNFAIPTFYTYILGRAMRNSN